MEPNHKNYVGGAGTAAVAVDASAVTGAAAGMEVKGAAAGMEVKGGPTANSSQWRWQFNGGSIGCITQTAGVSSPFATIPSTAWLTFRRNIVHNSGAVLVGTSHETLDVQTAASPALGYHMVVEDNVVRMSSACVLINSNFTQVTGRGNRCP